MVINIHNGDDGAKPPSPEGGSPEACSTSSCGEGLEKVYPTAAIRYGYMKTVGEFKYPAGKTPFSCGAPVVIQTQRGIEIGEMVSLTCSGCDKHVSREQIRRYVENSGPDYYQFANGKILRLATSEDLLDWERIRAETLRKKVFCQERARAHQLPMKVLECEHLFGGERIIFFFMAEGRVDFRALVRQLAEEFQTRIEMRQVGARDEARLLADYETCGRECCCKTFLKTLKPVSMKMAKMQKATLDPAKVSGRCGRLKCCLRYERTTYEELQRKLPSLGTKVVTEHGAGTVVARQILTQLVQIETPDGGRLAVPVEDIVDEAELARRQAEKAKAAAEAAAAQTARNAELSPPPQDAQADGNKSRRPRRARRKPRSGRRKSSRAQVPEGTARADRGSPPSPPQAAEVPEERPVAPRGEEGEATPHTGPAQRETGEGSKRRRRRRGRRTPRRRGAPEAKGGGDRAAPTS